MIGQQLDLFGGPLRPPKKILVDEQPEQLNESSADSKPTKDAAIAATDPVNIHVEIPVSTVAVEASTTIDGDEVAVAEGIETTEEELFDEEEEPGTRDEQVENETAEIPNAGDPAPEIALEPVAPGLESIPEPLGVEELDEADITEENLETESLHETTNAASNNKSENIEIQQVAFRGRKSGDPDEEMEMLNVPPDEELFKRQYYSMRETAAMFNVNQALLRFWENEFDILQPKKNKKGDRYFRPVDVKNLVMIYHLLRVRKFTMEGAKDYLHTHKKAGDSFQLVQRLEKLKSFLLELKANL